MQDCCRAQAGQGEYCQPGPSGRLKPKPRHHPRRRYRSGEDQYAPEVEAPAPVHESLRSSGRTSPHPAWPSAHASRLPLQPVHGYECHAGVDLAIPAPVDDPRLLTVRRQIVCCGPGHQDGLTDFKRGTDFIRGTEQLSHQGICVHETPPFARFFCVRMGCRPRRAGPM